MMMRPLDDANLSAKAFFASSYDNDECGSNGLPLTPNSIRIVGRFQALSLLDHPNLCAYIDIKRGKHEQIMVVTEGQDGCLEDLLSSANTRGEVITRLSYEVLSALRYLHNEKITHRNLSLNNILLDKQGTVKLSDYGLYHMTENGASVSFPIGDPVCLAPEVYLLDSDLMSSEGTSRRRTLSSSAETELLNPRSASNVDSWSLGVVLLQLVAGKRLWATRPVHDVIGSLLDLLLESGSTVSAYDKLLSEFTESAQLKVMSTSPDILDLIQQCLIINPVKRLSVAALMSHRCFDDIPPSTPSTITTYKPMKFNSELRCADLTIEQIHDFSEREIPDDYFHLKERSFEEVYYLWKLAGGDLEAVLKKGGLIKNSPPVVNMHNYVSENGDAYGAVHDTSSMYSDQSVSLDLSQLCERLADLEPEDYYPLIVSEEHRHLNNSMADASKLPLNIRERDVEYQFHRIVLFDRLLKGFPHTKTMLLREARRDIPPLCRAPIWAAILDVQGDIYEKYDSIDKVTSQPIDRQIEVDIPRCHQYNELMSSPEAHRKLKRVLKAWVSSHPQYVYWQGLDSLSAPFIYLSFNDEALAYACMSKFISKYLYNFFLKDNSSVIQEYLAMFSQLIAFHEPELSNHLEEIGFSPDLYAIPWFLTMYAHVFPLHRLFHLWDTLLLGASVFPLCIGVAILHQLKSRLLSNGFNECILLFSDLPEVDMDQCVSYSVKVFRSTTKSSTARVHAPPQPNKQNTNAELNKSAYEKSLAAEALPLTVLKTQRCFKISAEEMLSLLTPSSDWKQSKPKLIVIDIRTADEYQKGTIPGAIHSPHQAAFTQDGRISSAAVKEFLDEYKYQVKVVIDSHNAHCGEFASKLVSLGYSKVCYLHKGMNILRGSNLLVVPSPDM